jgi:hypothetical protein
VKRLHALFGLLALCACSAEETSRAGNISPGSGGTTGGSAGSGAPGVGGLGVSGGSGAGTGGSGGDAASAGGGGTGAVVNHPPPRSPTASLVYVDGRRLMVGKRRPDGSIETPTPFKLKGVCWSPTGIGETNENGYAGLYTKYGPTDSALMSSLNANAVKTYGAFETNSNGEALLDNLYQRGVMVIMSVILWHGTAEGKRYLDAVGRFKDHPAILLWLVGNEINYNSLYGAASYQDALRIVNTAIDDIHAADPDHPVAVSFGEIPTQSQYAQIPNADLWSINLYPSLNFAHRFNTWTSLSEKPLMVGEYGADAYDTNARRENQTAQADAVAQLTQQIVAQYSADDPSHAALGGTPFTLSDEWWKSEGEADVHDTGGFQNAVHPDNFANEEWWGLCSIQRTPRAAFTRLSEIYAAIR